MMRKWMATTLCLVAGAVTLTVGLARSRIVRLPWQPHDELNIPKGASRDSVQPLYDAVPMCRTTVLAGQVELSDLLASALKPDMDSAMDERNPAYTREALQDMVEQLSTVMYHRWWSSNFESYHAAMESAGYRLRSTEGLVHWAAVDPVYPQLTGQAWDPTLPPEQITRAIWEARPPGKGLAAKLAAIAADSSGMRVGFARLCPGEDQIYPLPPGPLGQAGWLGDTVGAFSRFYEPKSGNRLQDLLRAHRCVELATVGVLMRFDHGQTYPFLFWFWFDPEEKRWMLDKVGVGNQTPDFGGIFF
ncbi:MAG: hypothetical protein D6695_06235 [Planctomycetota bacterium]|nr:MAG: hypothetical protein D6695_06235 [Planctomycetota bacterium]